MNQRERPPARCPGCNGSVTWAALKLGYARMLEAGLAADHARAARLCPKCTGLEIRVTLAGRRAST